MRRRLVEASNPACKKHYMNPTKDQSKPAPLESAPQPERKQKPRLWCGVRIVDYRLQALAPVDKDNPTGDQEWCDLGGDTMVTSDREWMFQACRAEGGLLMSVNGLPGSGRVAAFHATCKALEPQG